MTSSPHRPPTAPPQSVPAPATEARPPDHAPGPAAARTLPEPEPVHQRAAAAGGAEPADRVPTPVPRPAVAAAPSHRSPGTRAADDGGHPDPVLVAYGDLLAAVAGVFAARGMAPERAARAAEALCYGDLTGMASHGLANLARLYVPLFDTGRVAPDAEPEIVADRGASVLLDAHRALGLWAAGVAMDVAVERAATYGIGLVSVRGGTHLGCLGHHALRAVEHGMIGLVTSNCGRQRIARPPGGAAAMLGTNPLSLAAPAGPHHPFVLDMSTTTAPTGRVRLAARAGREVPAGWLYDDTGHDVTDPAAFDRGDAHLSWLGGQPDTGAYKGYGLGLLVEVLSALVGGSGFGPAPDALRGDGRPSGRDDDIGYLVAAIAPARLRDPDAVTADAASLFGSLLACPPADPAAPVGYPGHPEAERAARRRVAGVPVAAADFAALRVLAATHAVPLPEPFRAPPPQAAPAAGQPAAGPAVTPAGPADSPPPQPAAGPPEPPDRPADSPRVAAPATTSPAAPPAATAGAAETAPAPATAASTAAAAHAPATASPAAPVLATTSTVTPAPATAGPAVPAPATTSTAAAAPATTSPAAPAPATAGPTTPPTATAGAADTAPAGTPTPPPAHPAQAAQPAGTATRPARRA